MYVWLCRRGLLCVIAWPCSLRFTQNEEKKNKNQNFSTAIWRWPHPAPVSVQALQCSTGMAGRLAARCRQLLNSHAAPSLPASAAHCRQQAAGFSGRPPPARVAYADSRLARHRAFSVMGFTHSSLLHTAARYIIRLSWGVNSSSRCCSAAQGPAPSIWGPMAFCAGTSAAAFALAASASDEREGRATTKTDRLRHHLGKPRSRPPVSAAPGDSVPSPLCIR